MGVGTPLTTVAFASSQRTAAAYSSGPLVNAGEAEHVVFYVDVSAASGDTHTLDVILQTSADASSWSSVTRSAITQITATTGYAYGFAAVANQYVQVLATVGGTNVPTVTFSVVAVIF